jgi:hypothetical protein
LSSTARTVPRESSPISKRAVLGLYEEQNMAYPTDEQIRERAYQLWEQLGRPEGRADEFWHLAEQDLLNEDRAATRRTPDNL